MRSGVNTIETPSSAVLSPSVVVATPAHTVGGVAEAGPGHAPRAALDRSLIHGLAWTGSIKWVGQLLSWATTLVVARVLTPADYGLVGMASIYLMLASLISEFSMGAAVVTLRDLSSRQIAQINSVSVIFGFLAFGVSCLAAWPLGVFFKAPELPLVVIAMSTTFVISGFKTVPMSLIQRDLQFKRIALIDGIQTLVLSVGILTAAFLGFRYWTLVIGAVLGAIVSTALMLAQRPFPFAWPSLESLRTSLRFSSHVLLQRISFFAYSDSDFLVIGRQIGREALGAYTFAWTLASVPIEKVTSLITGVTPAIFAAAQTDRPTLRRYFLNLSEAISYITLPTTIGLALVAPELVQLALGDRWVAMIAPLRLLALYAGVRSLTPLLFPLANVTGDSRYAARANAMAAVALPISFVLAARWGTAGVAGAWMLVHPIVIVVPMGKRIFARLDLKVRTYLSAIWPALSGTAAMALCVFAVRLLLPSNLAVGARLTSDIAAGVAGYGLLMTTVHRTRLRSALSVWKAIRS